MKHSHLIFASLIMCTMVYARLDFTDFKSASLPIPSIAMSSMSASTFAGIGILGFAGYKAHTMQKKLIKDKEIVFERLTINQGELTQLDSYKKMQLGVVNYVNKEYLKSRTDENWCKYKFEQDKLDDLTTQSELKEAVVNLYVNDIRSLEGKISSVNKIKNISFTLGGFMAGWGLWNLLFKK